jgi:hypothetical protein
MYSDVHDDDACMEIGKRKEDKRENEARLISISRVASYLLLLFLYHIFEPQKRRRGYVDRREMMRSRWAGSEHARSEETKSPESESARAEKVEEGACSKQG